MANTKTDNDVDFAFLITDDGERPGAYFVEIDLTSSEEDVIDLTTEADDEDVDMQEDLSVVLWPVTTWNLSTIRTTKACLIFQKTSSWRSEQPQDQDLLLLQTMTTHPKSWNSVGCRLQHDNSLH